MFGGQRTWTGSYDHRPMGGVVRTIVRRRCALHATCDSSHHFDDDALATSGAMLHPVNGQLMHSFDVDAPRTAQVCCLTATPDPNISKAFAVRKYPHYYSDPAPDWITRYNEGVSGMTIPQVLRATTATPAYFEGLKLGARTKHDVAVAMLDGGIRENNPVRFCLSDFHSLFDGKFEDPALLLSIGAGTPDDRAPASLTVLIHRWLPFRLLANLLLLLVYSLTRLRDTLVDFLEREGPSGHSLAVKYSEGKKQHLQMREHAREEHNWYKRLDVKGSTNSLADVKFDDWQDSDCGPTALSGGATLRRIHHAARLYLNRQLDAEVDDYAPPNVAIRHATEKLIRHRRARARLSGKRWEVFAGVG
jgi:hypothetical protein